MKISPKQISLFTEDELTSSPAGFHVNLTAAQGKDLEKKMTDISGLKCLEQFGRFSRVGLWEKTFAALLIGQEDWYSTKCNLIWKLKGTKSNRFYFQLVPLTLHTEGIESGLLLKTPTMMDGTVTSGKKNPTSGDSGTLAQEIMSEYAPTINKINQMLPTPVSSDATTGSIIGKNDTFKITSTGFPRKINQNGTNGSVGLARLGIFGMLPTPKTFNGTPNGKKSSNADQGGSHGVELVELLNKGLLPTPLASEGGKMSGGPTENQMSLSKTARQQTGKTSQLNPRFVMEMMGFPPDWTELPFLNGETNPSKEEEMQ
jgi:hypothetical protein